MLKTKKAVLIGFLVLGVPAGIFGLFWLADNGGLVLAAFILGGLFLLVSCVYG